MCRLLLMTIALLLILFGVSGLWMMPKLVQQKIEQRLQLKIGTKTFDRFTKVPIPLTVKFYLFNVTNSEKVLAGLERPQFQEVGPFMYKQWRRREIVDFEDYNRRLRYKEFKTFYSMFNGSSSPDNGINNKGITTRHNSDSNTYTTNSKKSIQMPDNYSIQSDVVRKKLHNDNNIKTAQQTNPFMLDPHRTNVTIINLPLLSVLTKLAQLEEGSLKRNIAAKVAKRLIIDGKDKILITRPANELLFDGYKVDFMESARDLVSGTLGYNFESPLPKNMFGFFYMKNNTWTKKENGELTVFTGRNDSMDNFMIIDNWNDQKQLSVWPSNTVAGNKCNEIHGTDGSQFHPGANKNQLLSIFSPMICTSLKIHYKEDTQTRDIPLLRFTPLADMFGAPKKNPKNACYCTIQPPINGNQSSNQRINDSRCYLDGLMDLSLCQRGAPIAASSPHFYNGDPMLAMAAGLKPNKEIHETYLDIEPMTGAVMRAASRAQLNAYVEQAALEVIDSNIIGSMTPMVAPLLWLEEAAEIDEKSSNEFKNQLLHLVQKARRSFVVAIALGILLALVVGGQYCYITSKIDVSSRELRKSRMKKRTPRAHLRSNLRLGGGARRSNLYGDTKPALLDHGDAGGGGVGSGLKAVIPAAAILGAASAGPSNRPKDRRRGLVRGVAEDGDEDLSRKLVANEWDIGEATTASSSGHSSHQGVDHQRPDENREEDSDEEPCSGASSSSSSGGLTAKGGDNSGHEN